MTQMKIGFSLGDRIRSKRGSAKACLIATAGKRQWGGDWNVTPRSVERDTGTGQVQKWRPSFGAHLVMMLFDAGLPVPVRSVKLIRGKADTPAARRARTVRRAAAGAGGGAALVLAANGLEWIIYALAGALVAAAAVATTRKVRRRPAVTAPPPPRASRPALPARPAPELESVQPPAPKAIRETVPAPQKVASARN